MPTEREFDGVDGEVEPGTCADHDHLGIALGKKVKGGDWPGCVRNHGRDPGGPSATQPKERVGGEPGQQLGANSLDENDSDQAQDDPAQSMAKKLCRDSRHDPPTCDDADTGGWQESAQDLPGGVLMKGANGQYVAKNQKGKNNSRGFLGRHDLCHKNNCE